MSFKYLGLAVLSLGVAACASTNKSENAAIAQNLEAMVGQSGEILTAKLGAPDFDVKLDASQRALIWDTYKVTKLTSFSGELRTSSATHVYETSKGCSILIVVNESNIIQKWEMRHGRSGCPDYLNKLI